MSNEEKKSEAEEEVTVKDRRRVFVTGEEKQGEDSPGETSQPEPESSTTDATDESEPSENELPDVDVYALVRWFISMLTAQAWQHMGLVMNPQKKLVIKDLSQAKFAVDCVASLIQQLEPNAETAEKRELQALLSNLRLNFVQQSNS